MSVTAHGSRIRLSGACKVEEAEILVGLLQSGAYEAVDIADCREMHSALAQALLAFKPPLIGTSTDPFIRDLLAPALAAAARERPGPASTGERPDKSGAEGFPPRGEDK